MLTPVFQSGNVTVLSVPGRRRHESKTVFLRACPFSHCNHPCAGFRFYQLGTAPLTDKEAYWANQALLVSKWESNVEIWSNSGYVLLTGAIFSIFGTSEFTAVSGLRWQAAWSSLFPGFYAKSLIITYQQVLPCWSWLLDWHWILDL